MTIDRYYVAPTTNNGDWGVWTTSRDGIRLVCECDDEIDAERFAHFCNWCHLVGK